MPHLLRQTFTIASRADLAHIRHFITVTGAQVGADEEKTADLVTAVNELTTNTYEHGFSEKPCQIEVNISFEADILSVQLVDSAPQFDPTISANPDITAPLSARGAGGMGILMVREFTDRFTYQRTASNQNSVTVEIGEKNGN